MELIDADAINRQDAIKAVASAIWHYPKLSLLNNYHFAYELAKDALKRLPLAEPEIIRCKDCKHYTNEFGWNGEEYTFCSFCSEAGHHRSLVSADDFCSRAERRTEDGLN